MNEPKLNYELPYLHIKSLLSEANAMSNTPYDEGLEDDIVVLVLKRSSVEFQDPERSMVDYENITIKTNPEILAVATMENDGTIRNAARRLGDFPPRLKQKTLLAFKALIGSLGIYPFKRIWALTTPLSWRDESDLDFKLKETGDYQ